MTYHRRNSSNNSNCHVIHHHNHHHQTKTPISESHHQTPQQQHLNRQNVSVFYTIPRTILHFSTATPFKLQLYDTTTSSTSSSSSYSIPPHISTSLHRYLHEINTKISEKQIDIDYNLFSYLHKSFYIHKVAGGPFSMCNQVACQLHMYTELQSCTNDNNHNDINNVMTTVQPPPPPPHIIHPFADKLDISFFEYIELSHVIHIYNEYPTNMNFLYFAHTDSTHHQLQFKYATTFLRKKQGIHDKHVMSELQPEWRSSTIIPSSTTSTSSTSSTQTDHIIIDGRCTVPNEHETTMNTLFYIIYVLSHNLQKPKSSMIICLNDCFTAITLDMLYLITFFYERSFFIKPIVCNLASGTRYLVCKGFRPYRNLELLQNSLSQLYSDIHTHLTIQPELPIYRFLHQHIPYMFYSKIEEINSILNQPRLEFMHQRINYHESEIEKRSRTKTSTITSTSLDHPRKTTIFEIKKCIDWCNRFQMPVQNAILHVMSSPFVK